MEKYKVTYLLRDFLILFLGIALISLQNDIIHIALISFSIFIVLEFSIQLISVKSNVVKALAILYIILAIIVVLPFNDSLWVFSLYIAIYNIDMAIINLVTSILRVLAVKKEKKSQVKSVVRDIFRVIVAVALAIIYLLVGIANPILSIITGIYCIILSTYHLTEGRLFAWLKYNARPIFINYPIIFDIPLPFLFKNHIDINIAKYSEPNGKNQFLQSLTWTNPNMNNYLNRSKDMVENIVTIQVVTGNNPIDIVGHTAVTYMGKTYTYGNHDIDARNLFAMIGKGVLVVSSATDMASFNKKLGACVFEYKIFLNNLEIESFKKHIEELEEATEEWKPDDKLYKKRYAGVLNRTTDTRFYKYDSGIYENYFLLGTNCAWIENRALNKSTIPNLLLTRVTLPGTVFYMLEQELGKKNTTILSRKVIY